MHDSDPEYDQLVREHRALLCDYGQVQARCSQVLHAQAREIDRLQAQALRLRAELVMRVTELAWVREEREALQRVSRGARPPLSQARASVRAAWVGEPPYPEPPSHRLPDDGASCSPPPHDEDALDASLHAADLVICQTGCLGHGAFWRVQDHCRRTGKACVLVDQAEALRIVRIQGVAHGRGQECDAATPAPPAQ